jgi:WD40 repeat protein
LNKKWIFIHSKSQHINKIIKGSWSNQPLTTLLEESQEIYPFRAIELKNGDFVSATTKGAINIWRIENGRGELTKIIHYPNRSICRIVLLANGDIACGFDDGVIQIWNVDKGVMDQRLCEHVGYVDG